MSDVSYVYWTPLDDMGEARPEASTVTVTPKILQETTCPALDPADPDADNERTPYPFSSM